MATSTEVVGHSLLELGWGEGIAFRGVGGEELRREPVAREPGLTARILWREGIEGGVQPVPTDLLELRRDGALQATRLCVPVSCHGGRLVERPKHRSSLALGLEIKPGLAEGGDGGEVGACLDSAEGLVEACAARIESCRGEELAKHVEEAINASV